MSTITAATNAADAAAPSSKVGAPKVRASVRYRTAAPDDGRAVHRLVHQAGGLELNTGYAYVLLCDHFAATTVLAESDGELVGFVAAYVPPRRHDAVFVWQVGVHPEARGLGIASSLLDALISREACRGVELLEATVSPSNEASRRLFESFAGRHGAPFAWSDGYPATHFDGPHGPEHLIRIGPMRSPERGRADSSSSTPPDESDPT